MASEGSFFDPKSREDVQNVFDQRMSAVKRATERITEAETTAGLDIAQRYAMRTAARVEVLTNWVIDPGIQEPDPMHKCQFEEEVIQQLEVMYIDLGIMQRVEDEEDKPKVKKRKRAQTPGIGGNRDYKPPVPPEPVGDKHIQNEAVRPRKGGEACRYTWNDGIKVHRCDRSSLHPEAENHRCICGAGEVQDQRLFDAETVMGQPAPMCAFEWTDEMNNPHVCGKTGKFSHGQFHECSCGEQKHA